MTGVVLFVDGPLRGGLPDEADDRCAYCLVPLYWRTSLFRPWRAWHPYGPARCTHRDPLLRVIPRGHVPGAEPSSGPAWAVAAVAVGTLAVWGAVLIIAVRAVRS